MSYLKKGENGENWESMGNGKIEKKHQKPMGINGEIVKMRYARKMGELGEMGDIGKWEN